MLKKHWFYKQRGLKTKKPLVLQCSLCKWRTKHKKVKKPLRFYRKKISLHQKQYIISKNSNENARIWGTLAAPVAANSGRKTCAFPYVNWERCKTITFYVKNFQPKPKTIHNFKKLQRERFKNVRGHRAGARAIRSPLTIWVRTL